MNRRKFLQLLVAGALVPLVPKSAPVHQFVLVIPDYPPFDQGAWVAALRAETLQLLRDIQTQDRLAPLDTGFNSPQWWQPRQRKQINQLKSLHARIVITLPPGRRWTI